MKELLPGLLMLLSVLTSLRAQSPSADSLAAAYPFLKIGENCLHFPGGDSLWGRLFQKLHEVGKDSSAQLRVLHIGGSHVQGGVFHERIRLGLEAL
ncbi:hypothetical protein RZS08_51270, partial [Arthrospira platensis SPKY1]|nr:hypothetical protein [Arthrospira platensis SPKY1]